MNYKVRCTGYNQGNEKYFTIGKVYDVVNNTIKNDNGFVYESYNGRNIISWLSRWYKFERVSNGDKKIIITTDGKTTTAALYDAVGDVVKTAKAECNPCDTFDFIAGANLALERLLEKPLYSGKVVCIDVGCNEGLYTRGRIYQFDDGVITCDNGKRIDNGTKGFRNFKEFENFTSSEFIEIKE